MVGVLVGWGTDRFFTLDRKLRPKKARDEEDIEAATENSIILPSKK